MPSTPPTAASSALAGRTIAITRPANRSRRLTGRLESLGATVLVRPLIEIGDPESLEPLDAAIDRLASFDWVLFTSVNGAGAFARRMREKGKDPAREWTARVGAVGEATAARLREEGMPVDVVASSPDSEGLAADLPMSAMAGREVLLARAAEGRDVLPRALEAAGARLTVAVCYRTIPRLAEAGRLAGEILSGTVDALLLASPSAVNCLAQALVESGGKPPGTLSFVCIGPVTASAARGAGWDRIVTCETPGDDASLAAILSVLTA